MTANGIIQRKLELIAGNVRRLRKLGGVDVQTLEQDFFLKSGIERTLQISIEAMIDVANRIISLDNRPAVSESYQSLTQIEDMGIIERADRYRDMIRFRNLIVHRYEFIDPEILIGILERHLPDFDYFVKEIEDHV